MIFSKKFIAATKEYTTFFKFVPAPYLRRGFELSDEAKSAKIRICGLGFYELFVNGEKITKGLLAPYISNPDDLLYYDEYDIAKYLKKGKNVIAILLGNGMLNCPGGQIWDFDTALWRSAPKVALCTEIETADGKTLSFEADETFKTAPSPIYFDDLRVGEFYDARCEIKGWNLPDFDDSAWSCAIPAEAPRGEAVIGEHEPIKPMYEIKPVSIRRAGITYYPDYRPVLPKIKPAEDETAPEGYLYDFGTNNAGLCRLKIKGKPGQKVVLQFCEQLAPNGGLDLRGMNFLPERFNHREIYICRGEGEETYIPSFCYFGFRYVLVYGIDEKQADESLLTYVVYNSDIKKIGGFECSDSTVNALMKCAEISDLSNFYYFPTDCPQREKNGWTADAALSAEHVLTYFTPEASYREWLRNIRKAQAEDGSLPGIIPTSGWGFEWGNGPAWDSVCVYLPYFTYKYRADKRILAENATMIFRYLSYLSTRRNNKGLVEIGLGDWCHAARSGAPKAPLVFTDTVMTMDLLKKSSLIFDVLGLKHQKDFVDGFYNDIRECARKYLLDKTKTVAFGGCQTTQAMAIFYDLFEDAEKPEAFAELLRLIEENDNLIDVGVLGIRILFHVLSDFGKADLAFDMITTKRFPSYGCWIDQGATTLYENFIPRGDKPDSRNHHFLGDITSWFMQVIAGLRINPYVEDVNEIEIRPSFVRAIDHAHGYHDHEKGRIDISWRREDDNIILEVSVPSGVYGNMVLPAGYKFEDGETVKAVHGATFKIIPANKRDTLHQIEA